MEERDQMHSNFSKHNNGNIFWKHVKILARLKHDKVVLFTELVTVTCRPGWSSG
jgi:hypothetical protein